MALADRFLEAIRAREGFTPRATWDFKQHSIGFGTRARHPGEVIDEAEADRRFREEIADAAAMVDQFAPGLDEGTRAALTSLTFNAGTGWMRAGLGEAIRAGNMDRARDLFTQYVRAGGEVQPGLVSRRNEEVGWFGQASGEPVQPQIASSASVPTRNTETPPTGFPGAGKGNDMDFMALLAGMFGGGGTNSRRKRSMEAAQNAFANLDDSAPMMDMPTLPRGTLDLSRLREAIASRSGFGRL